MHIINVQLGTRSYPIYIGDGLLSSADTYAQHIVGKQIMVVTNATIADLYLESLTQTLSDFEVHAKVIGDGEKYKNIEVLNTIFDALLKVPCDRHVTMIALGGGVVGDITGFAAACYQRGVALLQVPTTLLAQVDSSVGGKTAINHKLGKNMIGAFYQPRAVVADTGTLRTLPEREFKAGLAEVIKYGLLGDTDFFQWLESNMDKLARRDHHSLIFAVERSCLNKSRIVAADEREQGRRALLNLGHTFGHAIETATNYDSWLHGEAIGVGMLMAADLSLRLGHISADDFRRIMELIKRAGLPSTPPEKMSPEKFLSYMSVDKKVKQGSIRLVLLRAIGDAYLSDDYPPLILQETLQHFSAA